MAKAGTSAWDLTALFNAADPKAGIAERHLWVIRLVEWLRHAPLESAGKTEARATPTLVLRLRHLLGVLERNPEQQARAAGMLGVFLREVDSAALLAAFGFAPRTGLWGELGRCLRARVLPLTPATSDLGELSALLFPHGQDIAWLGAIDDETLARLARVLDAGEAGVPRGWRIAFFEAITFLASAIRAAGFSPHLRQRMSAELLVDSPFHQLARVAEKLRKHGSSDAAEDRAEFIQEAQYLRAIGRPASPLPGRREPRWRSSATPRWPARCSLRCTTPRWARTASTSRSASRSARSRSAPGAPTGSRARCTC